MLAVLLALLTFIGTLIANQVTAIFPPGWSWARHWWALLPAAAAVVLLFGICSVAFARRSASPARLSGASLQIIAETRATELRVGYLTSRDLSREIWHRRLTGEELSHFSWPDAARAIAAFDESVGEHLMAERRLVPDSLLGDNRPQFRVGITFASARLSVRIRNTGGEAGGFSLRPHPPTVLQPPQLTRWGGRVTCTVTIDDAGSVTVRRGEPAVLTAQLELRLELEPARQGSPVALAQAAQALAAYLSGAVGPVPATGEPDSGVPIQAELTVRLSDPDALLTVSDLDLDELEGHVTAIDTVVEEQYGPARLRSLALTTERLMSLRAADDLLSRAAAEGSLELTPELRDELGHIAGRLSVVAEDTGPSALRLADRAAALSACRTLLDLVASDPAGRPSVPAGLIADLIAAFQAA
jgi:hypothetical protein